ncbi:MAG TPA: hypothetical protein VFK85_12770 [Anaeromyxobacteraceae bacterium]|nr:hypothetical protein [Anaeromyxobacteraceae bacterium]
MGVTAGAGAVLADVGGAVAAGTDPAGAAVEGAGVAGVAGTAVAGVAVEGVAVDGAAEAGAGTAGVAPDAAALGVCAGAAVWFGAALDGDAPVDVCGSAEEGSRKAPSSKLALNIAMTGT